MQFLNESAGFHGAFQTKHANVDPLYQGRTFYADFQMLQNKIGARNILRGNRTLRH